ncbi:MAG: 16S rRNA (uracil(1498)-N(3))-methyltransferase [Chloroflexia bacterium]
MHRFFLPAGSFGEERITVEEPEVIHRIADVLRLRAGDRVICLDNSGWEFQVVLEEVGPRCVTGWIEKKCLSTSEPPVKVALYQAVLKGERFEWALQKGTEVGVSEFVPLLTERCIVQDASQLSRRKLQRWQKILQAAAEQSGRGRIPTLQPLMLLPAACERIQLVRGLGLIPWEAETRPLRQVLEETGSDRPFNVSLLIGPEGGFSTAEVELARGYGIQPVSLGPRILRAETAGVVAAVLVLYHYGALER